MRTRLSILSSSVLLGTFVFAQLLPGAEGARTVRYAQTDIVPIHAKVRFSTLIVLPADEEILDFTTGDRDFWIINGAHNLCYVHPAAAGIRSNLNLVTASGHVYSFLLTEISNQPGLEPDLKVFVTPNAEAAGTSPGEPHLALQSEVEAYKQEAKAAEARAAEAEQQAQARVQQQASDYRQEYSSRLQFDYSYSRKLSGAPFLVSAIYHDDKFTYVKCGAREKPTLYEINDGKPNVVNFDYQNGVYIVSKIVDRGYLAVGKKKAGFERKGWKN